MKPSLVFLAFIVFEPIVGQYCPKECENQGILCNIKCIFSNIQTEFAKNNENNNPNGSNRDLNPTATILSNVPSDVKTTFRSLATQGREIASEFLSSAPSDVRATFRSLGTQGREIASEIKETAKSINSNPGGFASSLATRINEGLNAPTPTNLNEAFSSVKEGGNMIVSTLNSGLENGFGPTSTYSSSVPSDLKTTFRSLETQGREIASEIKETAKSVSSNPEGFASSLATRIDEGLNSTPTPTNLNEALSSVKEGGDMIVSTLNSGLENGFGPVSTYSSSVPSDFATTASIIGSEARNFASTLSSRFNGGSSTTASGSRASPMNSIGLANILGISFIALSSILLSSFI